MIRDQEKRSADKHARDASIIIRPQLLTRLRRQCYTMTERIRGVQPWVGVMGEGGVVRYQLKSGCSALTEQPDKLRGGWRRGRPYCEETIGNVCVSELGGLDARRCCFIASLM